MATDENAPCPEPTRTGAATLFTIRLVLRLATFAIVLAAALGGFAIYTFGWRGHHSGPTHEHATANAPAQGVATWSNKGSG